MDMLPYTNVKPETHSKEDQKVLEVLEQYPTSIAVDGVTSIHAPPPSQGQYWLPGIQEGIVNTAVE